MQLLTRIQLQRGNGLWLRKWAPYEWENEIHAKYPWKCLAWFYRGTCIESAIKTQRHLLNSIAISPQFNMGHHRSSDQLWSWRIHLGHVAITVLLNLPVLYLLYSTLLVNFISTQIYWSEEHDPYLPQLKRKGASHSFKLNGGNEHEHFFTEYKKLQQLWIVICFASLSHVDS